MSPNVFLTCTNNKIHFKKKTPNITLLVISRLCSTRLYNFTRYISENISPCPRYLYYSHDLTLVRFTTWQIPQTPLIELALLLAMHLSCTTSHIARWDHMRWRSPTVTLTPPAAGRPCHPLPHNRPFDHTAQRHKERSDSNTRSFFSS